MQTYKERNLRVYIDQFAEENNCFSDNGYIPEAKTAKIIGSQLIDKMTGDNRSEISGTTALLKGKTVDFSTQKC